MSNEDIDEAEKLLERATPGRAEAFTGLDGISRVYVDGCPFVVVCESGSVDEDHADADLIAHLRNHAPAWLKELRALRKLVCELSEREDLDHAVTCRLRRVTSWAPGESVPECDCGTWEMQRRIDDSARRAQQHGGSDA